MEFGDTMLLKVKELIASVFLIKGMEAILAATS
jgi:hypothetical protein